MKTFFSNISNDSQPDVGQIYVALGTHLIPDNCVDTNEITNTDSYMTITSINNTQIEYTNSEHFVHQGIEHTDQMDYKHKDSHISVDDYIPDVSINHLDSCDISRNMNNEASSDNNVSYMVISSATSSSSSRRKSYEPRSCPKCLRNFKFPSDLKKHLVIHTDIKKFQCEFCQKSFRRLHQLNVHKRIHTGEKPFKCEKCGVFFRHDSTYMMHIRTRHEKLKPYQCGGCYRVFGRMSHLRKHQALACENFSRSVDNFTESREWIGDSNYGSSRVAGIDILTCLRCNERFTHKIDYNNHKELCDLNSNDDQSQTFENDVDEIDFGDSTSLCHNPINGVVESINEQYIESPQDKIFINDINYMKLLDNKDGINHANLSNSTQHVQPQEQLDNNFAIDEFVNSKQIKREIDQNINFVESNHSNNNKIIIFK